MIIVTLTESFTVKAKETFLLNLKAIMDIRGLSYKDVGDLCGMSKQRISDIFNKDSNLSLNTTERIAKGLKIEETDMFDPNYKNRSK